MTLLFPFGKFRVYLLFTLFPILSQAQDTRAQYPGVLAKAYFKVNIGYINYPFSNQQLQPGYQVQTIHVPHAAASLVLLGYRFNPYLSAQISYMRPVKWVSYFNINGDETHHSVWMNVAGLTAKGSLPLVKGLQMYAEGGLGIITRHGIQSGNQEIMKDASYAAPLFGGGLQYKLNDKWQWTGSISYSPESKRELQPYTVFYGTGFIYSMRSLPTSRIQESIEKGYFFPKSILQIGYATNILGYGVNNLVSSKVPIFWGGDAQVEEGVSLSYQHNIFHARKVFSLDWGSSFSYWESNKEDNDFITLSLYPLLRFTVKRTSLVDYYFDYSVAGPTYISKTSIDHNNTGKHFTFQDMMGIGVMVGAKKSLNAEIRIAHYSNGNLFPNNAGVKIPLTLNVGCVF